MKFESYGTLRYSPKLAGNRNDRWWLVLDCEREIGRYYRKLFELYQYRCSKLQIPAWEEHITVIRDEEPPNKDLWEKYEGQKFSFFCLIPPATNYVTTPNDLGYFWLTVESPSLLNIREELGLTRNPEYPLHLTFGNLSTQTTKKTYERCYGQVR